MKKLTFSTMAAARLRANKRQYMSLVLGIFLSIFLISTLVLSVYGIYQAELQKRYDKVGYLDFVMLDNGVVTEEDIHSFDEFDRFGHAYISGIVTDKNVYVGYYDEVGLDLMNLKPVKGRLPESAGEITIEASAMDILDVSWQIGETVELAITPVDGTEETRSFTLVGILPERSIYLSISDHNGLSQFPAIVTSPDEPAFTVGRLGTHWLMGLAKNENLDKTIKAFWDKFDGYGVLGDFYGLSVTGEQRQYASLGGFIEADYDMLSLIMMISVLTGSLILSCCVGISGAMEGVLSKRREEIGVLRALGATRRQIRRMFGRENLILALIVSPLSIAVSMGAVWVLSLLLPNNLKFAVNLWLIIPIVLFSIVVILISGYLPLARASKQMPMSVIRDTAMLRRCKGIKSKKEFSATKLIAIRQVRFNPTRQIGASLLVGLMLLCSGLLSGSILTYSDYALGDHHAFEIRASSSWYFNAHIGTALYTSLNKQSLSQIRNLPNVESIEIDRHMTVTTFLDDVPSYVLVGMRDTQFGMLDDKQFEQAMEYQGNNADFYRNLRDAERENYQQFLKDYNISGEAFRMVIVSLDLNTENLDALKPYIESGKINVDAINAGEEVLVVAPEMWVKVDESGYGLQAWHSEEAVNNDPNGEGAVLAAWNDSFFAGETLPLIQLYRTEMEGPVTRVDAAPVIGAVLSWNGNSISGVMSDTYIITTEQGLENMGFPMEGLMDVKVYLEGDISLEEEETLERQLNAIARRNEGYTVFNYLENYREREAANQRQIMLFAAIAIVFFSVSVGMIVSSVTRQLNSEGRTIGMLRAVGADEKAILECYSGRINASIFGGMGITLALYFVYCLIYFAS
ncbi:MAG: ABC transporter permease, partial [Oscillospiraceae bacterium]|nr:ABC transporter permease [Oscillospiraceae bacterium]